MLDLQVEIFILVGIGYLISKLGLFNKQTRKQVTDLVLNLVLPVATAKSFLIKLTPSIMKTTLVVFLVSIGIQGLYFIINKTAYNNQEETKKINLQYATMVSNAGFMGMPFAQGLYGDMGLLYACIYLIPQRIFMWSYGLSHYTKADFKTMVKKVALHPCLIGIYFGIVFMIMYSLGYTLPSFVTTTMSSIGGYNTALSMIVIGSILSDVEPREILDKECIYYSFIRLIMIPVITYLCLRWTSLDHIGIGVSVVLAAMPAPSTCAMLANKYDKNPEFASKLIFVSTAFSLVTLPLISLMITL